MHIRIFLANVFYSFSSASSLPTAVFNFIDVCSSVCAVSCHSCLHKVGQAYTLALSLACNEIVLPFFSNVKYSYESVRVVCVCVRLVCRRVYLFILVWISFCGCHLLIQFSFSAPAVIQFYLFLSSPQDPKKFCVILTHFEQLCITNFFSTTRENWRCLLTLKC